MAKTKRPPQLLFAAAADGIWYAEATPWLLYEIKFLTGRYYAQVTCFESELSVKFEFIPKNQKLHASIPEAIIACQQHFDRQMAR